MTETIRMVCASRWPQQEFFQRSALGRSLAASYMGVAGLELSLFPANTAGLPAVYNSVIEKARSVPSILVFLHDDLHLVDFFWTDALRQALDRFDIVGLAGNRRRVPGQPSWAYTDERTLDSPENLSGAVGHGKGFPCPVRRFGPAPAACRLMDGLFLAARSTRLVDSGLRFDPRFQFDFYDLDFCREAERLGLTMGTWPIAVVHESDGNFASPRWRQARAAYLEKWGD
jgi:GT2 family glycosyltransferase